MPGIVKLDPPRPARESVCTIESPLARQGRLNPPSCEGRCVALSNRRSLRPVPRPSVLVGIWVWIGIFLLTKPGQGPKWT